MYMTFRWYGPTDPIPLTYIRQIPGVERIVSALYEVPVGEVWSKTLLSQLQEQIEGERMRFSVVESVPVHEDVKLGRPSRDRLIENYCESVRNMGELCACGLRPVTRHG